MKNVKVNQVRKCFLKDRKEFEKDVAEALGNDVKVFCEPDTIWFETESGDYIYTEEVLAGMSKYYDVEIICINVCIRGMTEIWVCYK